MIILVLLKLWTPWATIKGRIIDDSNPKTSIGGPHESRLSHAIDSCVAHLMEGYLDGQWTPQMIKHKKHRSLENSLFTVCPVDITPWDVDRVN